MFDSLFVGVGSGVRRRVAALGQEKVDFDGISVGEVVFDHPTNDNYYRPTHLDTAKHKELS